MTEEFLGLRLIVGKELPPETEKIKASRPGKAFSEQYLFPEALSVL
jgi:hypothetical protein